ncbi:MAG: hypothetical protein ACOCUT_01895 [bacterium]
MTRKEAFKDLLKNIGTQSQPQEHKYVGTGNPFADILIIGKEAAIEDGTPQSENEITSNFAFWNEVNLDNLNLELLPSDLSYSPLYPYKGQVFNIDNGSNRGTSRTWYNYQKFFNKVFDLKDNKNINFHEAVFITETNSTPSKKTRDAVKDSICFRKQNILSSKFIKNFPVIILAGVGYYEINDAKNEIEEIFDVKFQEKRLAGGKEKQPYWIHWNHDKTRLLINTYQLSMGISDDLLAEIAEEVKKSNLI